jgi:hypothetical protein
MLAQLGEEAGALKEVGHMFNTTMHSSVKPCSNSCTQLQKQSVDAADAAMITHSPMLQHFTMLPPGSGAVMESHELETPK